MSTKEPIDYKAVLADLEEKRVAIDRMIESVKQFIGLSISVADAIDVQDETAIDTGKPSSVNGDKPFLGLSIPDAVRKHLRTVKEKQSTSQIVEALERGGLQHISKKFWNTVYTTLQRVWDSPGDIVQVDGTNWGLAEWFPGRKFIKPKSQKGKVGRKPKDAKKVVVKATKPPKANGSEATGPVS